MVRAKNLELNQRPNPPTPQQRREAIAREVATWFQEQLNYIQGAVLLEGPYADNFFIRIQRQGIIWVNSHRQPQDDFPFFVSTSAGPNQAMYYVIETDLSIRHPQIFPQLSYVYNSFRNQLSVVLNYQNRRSNRR